MESKKRKPSIKEEVKKKVRVTEDEDNEEEEEVIIKKLKKETKKEEELPPIYFYSTKLGHREFSNFYASPINLDGKIWPTTEHYFQAQKYTPTPTGSYKGYDEMIKKILINKSPAVAKQLGSRSSGIPIRPDWETVKEYFMYKALNAKFTQHPKLKELLLSTKNAKISEHTDRDLYWGDGGGKKIGKDRLGILLQVVREELKSE